MNRIPELENIINNFQITIINNMVIVELETGHRGAFVPILENDNIVMKSVLKENFEETAVIEPICNGGNWDLNNLVTDSTTIYGKQQDSTYEETCAIDREELLKQEEKFIEELIEEDYENQYVFESDFEEASAESVQNIVHCQQQIIPIINPSMYKTSEEVPLPNYKEYHIFPKKQTKSSNNGSNNLTSGGTRYKRIGLPSNGDGPIKIGKKLLKIDAQTMIGAKQFKAQMMDTSDLHGRCDFGPRTKQKLREMSYGMNKLFAYPVLKQASDKILKLYQRNCLGRCQDVDPEFFFDDMPLLPIKVDAKKDKRRVTEKESNRTSMRKLFVEKNKTDTNLSIRAEDAEPNIASQIIGNSSIQAIPLNEFIKNINKNQQVILSVGDDQTQQFLQNGLTKSAVNEQYMTDGQVLFLEWTIPDDT